MKQKQIKSLLTIVGLVCLIFLFSGCQKESDLSQTNEENVILDSSQSDSNYSLQNKDGDIVKTLKIKDTCVGCGKCVKFAPEHFIMISSKKAQVISQENLDSEQVQQAIKNCPVVAIEIIQA